MRGRTYGDAYIMGQHSTTDDTQFLIERNNFNPNERTLWKLNEKRLTTSALLNFYHFSFRFSIFPRTYFRFYIFGFPFMSFPTKLICKRFESIASSFSPHYNRFSFQHFPSFSSALFFFFYFIYLLVNCFEIMSKKMKSERVEYKCDV